jgi:hypothetical protein
MPFRVDTLLSDPTAGDPPSPVDGERWYDSTADVFKQKRGGAVRVIHDRKINDSATVDPTANDDINAGYEVASIWINTDSDEFFVCADASAGAAVWTSTTATNVFGTHYHYDEDDAESSTGSNEFQDKLEIDTSSLPSGTYRIAYSCEVQGSNSSGSVCVQVKANSTIIADPRVEIEDNRDWAPYAGFKHMSLSGINAVTLKYKRDYTGHTAKIRYARLELWRVS